MSAHHRSLIRMVSRLVSIEREMQFEKWGEQHHSVETWMLILQEELGEFAKSYLEGDLHNAKQELIQVVAVAHAMLQNYIYPPNRETTDGNTKT